ncbi:MAG: hypothetical protein ACXWOL_14210 [Ktedonobacteraceae bacterium]
MAKQLDWNQLTAKQQEKARYRWRYGKWTKNAVGLFKMLTEDRTDSQVTTVEEKLQLTWKDYLAIASVILVGLFLMYLMVAYLIPGNMG